MGLQQMKERLKQNGANTREEMIKDGRDLLAEELELDPSYSPTMYLWKYNVGTGYDDRLANVRLYKRGYSSLSGNYQKFLTTIDTPIYIGDYLHDTKDDTYWIVSESFNVDDIHYQGKMIQCNYLLKWQTDDGNIIERQANIVTAAKYDTGQSGNATITITTNNYAILIGYDEYGLSLDGQKVFIDIRQDKPTKVFDITRSDDILYDAGNMGRLLSYLATKTELNLDADNQKMRICNYREPVPYQEPQEVSGITAQILGLSQLKLAFPRTYSVSFWDETHNEVHGCEYEWVVDADFDVYQTKSDGNITLRVDADNECGNSFFLRVIVDGKTIAETEIMVVEGM